jgi:acetyltransferase
VRLHDGAFVFLRATTVNDVAGLRAMFYTLSETTRYLYFGAGIPQTDAWAARTASLAVADGTTSYAMVATVANQVVGVARFVRNRQEADADMGILLTDAWQSRGLGREVLAFLRAEAESDAWALCGFTTVVLGENRRAMRLLRRAFPDLRAELSTGQFYISMPFASSQAEVSLARER